jgi:hypothetical protein
VPFVTDSLIRPERDNDVFAQNCMKSHEFIVVERDRACSTHGKSKGTGSNAYRISIGKPEGNIHLRK